MTDEIAGVEYDDLENDGPTTGRGVENVGPGKWRTESE